MGDTVLPPPAASHRPTLAVGHSPRTLSLAAGFMAAALLLLLTVLAPSGAPPTLSLLVPASGLLLWGLFTWLRLVGWRDPLDPVFLYPALMWLQFGVVPLLHEPNVTEPTIFLKVSSTDLRSTYVIVLLGISFFIVGYTITARPAARPVLSSQVMESIKPWRILVLFVAVLAARGALLVLGNFGYVFSVQDYSSTLAATGLLGLITSAAPYILILAAVTAARRGSKAVERYLFIGFVVVEVGLGLLAGTKTSLIQVIVAVAIGILYTHGRLPWKSIAASIIAFLIIVPSIQQYRDLLNETGQRESAPFRAVQFLDATWQTVVTSPEISTRLEEGAQTMLARLDALRTFAVIHALTPSSIPYQGGDLLFKAPAIALIPRFLWPTKPVLDTGGQTSAAYYGITGTSTAKTTLGDLYGSFGTPGVAIGMLLLGLGTGLVRRRFLSSGSLLWFLVYTVIVLTILLNLEFELVPSIAGVPRQVAVVLFIGWFATAGRQLPSTTRSRVS